MIKTKEDLKEYLLAPGLLWLRIFLRKELQLQVSRPGKLVIITLMHIFTFMNTDNYIPFITGITALAALMPGEQVQA